MKKKKTWYRSAWGVICDLFKKKPLGAFGMCFLLFMVLVAIFADQLAPYPRVGGLMQTDVTNTLQTSSAEHLLGTDDLGRDVLSYLIYGARTSVILCLGCVVIATIVAVLIGTLSAVIGGTFDLVIQRFVDAWLSIPSMLILMILMSLLGSGTLQLIFALSIPSGIANSRMIRSSAISIKNNVYIETAEHMGAGIMWKTVRHVIPNTLPLIIITAAGQLGGIILMEASLNFFGFGVDPATPSRDYMITNQGKENMYTAPWLSIYPGVLIGMMVFSANMFGDAMRDLLDPRLKGGVGSYSVKRTEKMAAKFMKNFEKDRQKKARLAAKAAKENGGDAA